MAVSPVPSSTRHAYTGEDNLCFALKEVCTNEDLTCAVCLDIFNWPKTLPCGHSFCNECLDRIIQESKRLTMYCPACRHCHNSIEIHQLSTNQALHLLAIESARQSSEVIKRPAITSEKEESKQSSWEEVMRDLKLGDSQIALATSIHTAGIFVSEPIKSAVLLHPQMVCLNTSTTIYCYKLTKNKSKSKLYWKRDYKNLTSLAASAKQIFATQRCEKLSLTSQGYSIWNVLVFNYQGEMIKVLPAGLGQDCSITSTTTGLLAIADTGSYKHNAQPCVISMTERGVDKQVVKPERSYSRLIKPTQALASSTNRLLVYDAGDEHLKSYVKSTINAMTLTWKQKVKNFISMATQEIQSCTMTKDLYNESDHILVFVTEGMELREMASGKLVQKVEHTWCSNLPSEVSILEDTIAVSAGRTVHIYTIEKKSINLQI